MPLPQRFSLLVLGQGSTGLEVVSWAVDHLGDRVTSVTVYGGAQSAPTERTRELEGAGVRFAYGTEDIEGAYDICVASPGISEFSEFFRNASAACGEIMGEPEFAWRLSPERWCAITGTNGKTTVTSLTNELLRASGLASVAVGNIGNAAIHEVDRRAEGEWFVAELSSYQIATTAELHPRVAILLNITPDHLAWHRTPRELRPGQDRLVPQHGRVRPRHRERRGRGHRRVRRSACTVPGRRVLKLGLADAGRRARRLCARWAPGGAHRWAGGGARARRRAQDRRRPQRAERLAAAAAALACGRRRGVRAGLAAFAPLPHRVEPVGEVEGVRYINDSKATNTDAVEKALSAFSDTRVILLLGGSDKGTPLADFMEVVAARVAAVVCFGAARERFRSALSEASGAAEIDIAEADDLRDAVDVARSLAQRGDVVLLSPACASFDEFSGFEERGDAFRAYVAELSAQEA